MVVVVVMGDDLGSQFASSSDSVEAAAKAQSIAVDIVFSVLQSAPVNLAAPWEEGGGGGGG